MIKSLMSKVVRFAFGPPVYLINPRLSSGFAFYGPERIANLVKRFGDGQYDTAPHESGTCWVLGACDDCARGVERSRAALHA